MPVKLMPYNPQVYMKTASSYPADICCMAISNTQQSAIHKLPGYMAGSQQQLIQRVAKMGHTSVFEHASMTLVVDNVSRGCMDQITRHRMCSFTCSSTHYEPHEDAIYLVDPRAYEDRVLIAASQQAHEDYIKARNVYGPEARQHLPLALSCRIIWTINARSLINFLRLRLCKRNMHEVQMVAKQVLERAESWFPELFDSNIALPECTRGTCDQGHMACGDPYGNNV